MTDIDREEILKIMNEADAVYLATVNGTSPRLRPLVNLRRADLYPRVGDFCRREAFVCYFSTSIASGKVKEIQANPSVAVYYCDPKQTRGIEFSGRMEILTDPELKKALWEDDWRVYWRGPDDPDYVVLRLSPSSASGWWGTKPFRFDLNKA